MYHRVKNYDNLNLSDFEKNSISVDFGNGWDKAIQWQQENSNINTLEFEISILKSLIQDMDATIKSKYSEEEVRKSLLDITLINPAHLSLLKSGYGQFPDTYEITEKGVDYILEQFKKK